MKDWKKFLLLLLVFFGGQIAAFAQKFSVKNRDGVKIQYQVISIEEKTVRVVGVGRTSMLTIPETVDYKKNSYTVVSIGMNVWGNQNNVTKQVTLPSRPKHRLLKEMWWRFRLHKAMKLPIRSRKRDMGCSPIFC